MATTETRTDSAASTPAPTTASGSPSPSPTPSVSTVPPVSALASAEGLVDVRTAVPDAVLDLRYATTNNFTHVQLYPADARCLVHESMVAGLRVAAARLRSAGYRLVFWDCYRPHAVQVRMFAVVPNPAWVAQPGPYATSHESARSVDVTLALADPTVPCAATERDHGLCLVDMGTGFDDFTPSAYAFATGITTAQRNNRATLRTAMNAGGLSVYSGEWWHFDVPGADLHRPILAAPVD